MGLLTVDVRATPAGAVVALAGALDYSTAPQVREAVERLTLAPGRQLVVDMGGLDFIDSSGLSTLLAAHHRAEEAHAHTVLAAVPERFDRVFRVTGLDQVFTAAPSADAAVEAWTAERGTAGDGWGTEKKFLSLRACDA
ncbi:STAS domain-containing protein [Streptomyces sp. NPDC088910]|uniref:STAS domain-containing protein n=1 Tax=Streptomyces sp. NPDC088910 TaxID=3365911 RepID=UPI003823ACDA